MYLICYELSLSVQTIVLEQTIDVSFCGIIDFRQIDLILRNYARLQMVRNELIIAKHVMIHKLLLQSELVPEILHRQYL